MQFWMPFHLPFSNLWSDQYSLSYTENPSIFSVIWQQLKEYWSDCESENGRWKSIPNCKPYVYVILRYDWNSNSWLEPTFWVPRNEVVMYAQHGLKTVILGEVWDSNCSSLGSSVRWRFGSLAVWFLGGLFTWRFDSLAVWFLGGSWTDPGPWFWFHPACGQVTQNHW